MRSHLSFSDLETIAESLAAGFEALQDQVQEQNKIEHELRIRLERAVEKVCLNLHSPLPKGWDILQLALEQNHLCENVDRMYYLIYFITYLLSQLLTETSLTNIQVRTGRSVLQLI